MNNLWPLQQAIFAALSAAPATYPVYDAVPEGAAAPYIAIGAFDAMQDDEIAVESTDATVTIHGWSRQPGKAQAHALLQFIRGRMHGTAIGGAWAITEDLAEVLEDRSSTAASRLYHAAARYRVRTN
jgi:hypothetical protein